MASAAGGTRPHKLFRAARFERAPFANLGTAAGTPILGAHRAPARNWCRVVTERPAAPAGAAVTQPSVRGVVRPLAPVPVAKALLATRVGVPVGLRAGGRIRRRRLC